MRLKQILFFIFLLIQIVVTSICLHTIAFIVLVEMTPWIDKLPASLAVGVGAVYYVGLIIWITDVTRNMRKL